MTKRTKLTELTERTKLIKGNEMASDFRELKIWQKGFELLIIIYRLTRKFPSEEKFGLTSQLRNSANSIIANIAESQGRYFLKDKIRVLYQSRGELEETRNHLLVAGELKYITEKEAGDLDNEYNGLAIGINSYIKSLNTKYRNLD